MNVPERNIRGRSGELLAEHYWKKQMARSSGVYGEGHTITKRMRKRRVFYGAENDYVRSISINEVLNANLLC